MSKTNANNNQTYDYVCFTDLVYEFDSSKKNQIEKKIKRRLKYYHLGEYDQNRVEYIRQFKNDLYSEISLASKSKYFHKSPSEFSESSDFNIEQMALDLSKKYGNIHPGELKEMIHFAIYLFYLR
ncbi:hypothetical protein K1X84_11950 [bacterium]|nr:hypothetical protein [bacterium]